MMICKCVNDEGVPALCCDGTCSSARMINPETQERAMEDSFSPRQVEQIKMIIRTALIAAPILDRAWQDGFVVGFKEGYEYGQ